MAKTNGRLTEKAVSEWFSLMDLEAQRNLLEKLAEVHDKVRNVRVSALRRELVMLENGSGTATQQDLPSARRRRASQSNTAIPSPAARGRDAAGWRRGWPRK